ncbi:UBX domain-containing protein 6-like [Ptychodera flava]|uniref:UBX domain-containing protein 6-like n=1 Tax=Ptychodera flava TaxID=63121 RepID=UPI00396A6849
MKKFFEKKKLDYKFKKAGEGHSLKDDTSSSSKNASLQKQPAARLQPTQDSQKAGEAALARMQPKHEPELGTSKRSIQAQVRREMEEEKRASEAAAAYSRQLSGPKETKLESAPMLSVERVLFYCSLSPKCVPRSEIESLIQECLLMKLADDPITASSTMIHTLNKDRDKVKVGVETICKYLDNIIGNPNDEKFRKIRTQNKAFQERVASLTGSEEFLQAVGFTRQMLPHQDTEAEFFVLSEDFAKDTDRLSAIRETLLSTEPVRPKLDRNLQVFKASGNVSRFQLPDEFYNLTPEEIKKEQQDRTDNVERQAVLRTKAMREREELKEIRKYNYTLIRIKFPDDIILQGVFRVREKLSALFEFVRQNLSNDWMPFNLSMSTGQRLTEEDAMLVSLQLVPAAVVNFSWDQSVMSDVAAVQGSTQEKYLKPALLDLIQRL